MKHRLPVVAVAIVLVAAVPASAGAGSAHTAGVGRELVLVSARTGAIDRSFPDVGCCNVFAAATDGHGGWFIAGDFIHVGKTHVDGIAHLHANGRLDTQWRGTFPGSHGGSSHFLATTMTRVGASLYVAGPFWVEALDARTGARRWRFHLSAPRSGDPGLAANRSMVFVAEGRIRVGGVLRPSPVALDAKTGAVLPWHASLPRKYDDAHALALDRGRLFVGAYAPNGYEFELRAFAARTGRLTSWQAPQIKDAGTIFVVHGLIFTTGLDLFYVASEQTGRPFRALSGVSGVVYAAAGHTLYVGGNVRDGSFFAGQKRDNLGAVDLRTNRVTPWAPKFHTRYVNVEALAADRNQVLVGGSFTQSLG